MLAARENFDKLIDDVNASSVPIVITNNNGKNAVLISEDDWRAVQESLCINSIPGLTESIIKAGLEKSSDCTRYNPSEEW